MFAEPFVAGAQSIAEPGAFERMLYCRAEDEALGRSRGGDRRTQKVAVHRTTLVYGAAARGAR